MAKSEISRCKRCITDSSVPDLKLDENGVCQFCHMHDEMEKIYPSDPQMQETAMLAVVEKIKEAGRGKEYDCVCGTSGGRDSTWLLHKAVEHGLRPLAVHFDNGWNSEIAVSNIRNACEILDVDLETVVADWSEFKDIQIAFLKASVPDVEVPTDLAIHSVLHKVAAKENIKYVLNGHSFRTEGIAPKSWTYMDGRYINSIQRQFGTRQLKDFHNFTLWNFLYYSYIKKIHVVPFLNYFPYDQAAVTKYLEDNLGWTYYGGHHHESYYTKFIQSYLLPKKFGIDKRKTELSALIRSGQITREQAMDEITTTPYEYDEELIDYSVAKLELSKDEWSEIYNNSPKSFLDYPTYYPLMKFLRLPLKLMVQMDMLPKLLYLKFLG